MQSDRIAVESIRAVSETKGPERGATLCENARSGCSHATIESKSQLRRIFDACAACRLNQSCAQMARGMVFAQPRAILPIRWVKGYRRVRTDSGRLAAAGRHF